MSTVFPQGYGDLNDGFVAFPADRAAAYRQAGYWTGQPLDSILSNGAANWPEVTAIVDAQRSYTFAELDAVADRVAGRLTALGLRAGDRVLLQLPNTTQFAVAFFGLLRAGVVPVMCLSGHRSAELSHFAGISGAVGLVITDTAAGFDFRTMAAQLQRDHPGLTHVIVDGDPGEYLAWSALTDPDGDAPTAEPARDGFDPAEPALLLVSGGTTGLPKLIARTHDDYVYTAVASAQEYLMTSDDTYLVALPAGHNFPLGCPGLLGAMTVGAPTVFTHDPSPENAFALIDKHHVTVTGLVNALAKVWAQACDWEPVLPQSLRVVQVGGSRMTADEAKFILDNLTPGLSQIFGMAEGMLNFTRPGDPVDVLLHTQGRPMSPLDEMLVVDEHGDAVAPGDEGELLVRGPNTINGYYRAEEANARSFSPEGYYRSGDRVRIFADGPLTGYVEVTGRIKDVIHRGGETVSASDLEEHLFAHPGIYAAAAVAMPDEYLGEKICAAVVFSGKALTLAELNSFLDSRGVSSHTKPDMLAPLPSLPKTAVGKVDKKQIVALLGSS